MDFYERTVKLDKLYPDIRKLVERKAKVSQMPNNIAASRNIFDLASSDYDRTYFDHTTGGFVLIHKGHNRGESFDSEVFLAKAFAKNGCKVKLLDESDTLQGRRPDAEINGEIWDFKRLTPEATAIANRVQAGIKEARKQGAVKVAYHIDRTEIDQAELKRGIKRAFELDLSQQILQVTLVFQNGNLIKYGSNDL